MSEPLISVCIVCRDEADKLGPCLASAAWADEIVLVDLQSEDGSAELARAHGARVISHPPFPIVEPLRNLAADEATGEWILALDPDERVTPGLARALRELSRRAEIDAVAIPFMNFDLGHAATHPLHRYDPKPRMYRKGRVRWPDQPNELPAVDGRRLHRLPHRDDLVMVHDRNRNLAEILDRVLRYAPAEAQALIDAGEVFTARRMLRVVGGKLHKQFVVGRPYDDGVPGLYRAAVLVAFHFYVWLEFWHRSGGVRTPEDDRLLRRIGSVVAALDRMAAIVRLPIRARRRLARARRDGA